MPRALVAAAALLLLLLAAPSAGSAPAQDLIQVYGNLESWIEDTLDGIPAPPVTPEEKTAAKAYGAAAKALAKGKRKPTHLNLVRAAAKADALLTKAFPSDESVQGTLESHLGPFREGLLAEASQLLELADALPETSGDTTEVLAAAQAALDGLVSFEFTEDRAENWDGLEVRALAIFLTRKSYDAYVAGASRKPGIKIQVLGKPFKGVVQVNSVVAGTGPSLRPVYAVTVEVRRESGERSEVLTLEITMEAEIGYDGPVPTGNLPFHEGRIRGTFTRSGFGEADGTWHAVEGYVDLVACTFDYEDWSQCLLAGRVGLTGVLEGTVEGLPFLGGDFNLPITGGSFHFPD